MKAVDEARQALAEAVKACAERGSSGGARMAAEYAEAYAWLSSPNQSHGGSVDVKS